jgi:outer membrane protein
MPGGTVDARHYVPAILAICLAVATSALAETANQPIAQPALESTTLLRTGITLNEAQDIALTQNRDVQQAILEVSRNDALMKSVIAQRYPKLLSFTFVGQQLNNPYPYNFATLPGVFQPLTQQYRLGLQVREAEALVRISHERLRRMKQEAVADVKRNFLSILALRSSIDSLQENLNFLRELERYVKSEAARGASLPVDVMLVQARTAKADYELEKARDDMETMNQTLNRLLARPVRNELKLLDDSTVAQIDRNANDTIDTALRNRPELSEGKLGIRRASLERKVQMSNYIPDVSVGGTGVFSHGIEPTLPKTLVAVGFLATWEPWDWGRRVQLSKESARKAQQEEIKLRDTAELVSIDADQARRAVAVAKKESIAGELGQASYREQLRVVNKRYMAGAALLKDVLEAQAAYVRAIAENVKAKIDIATARVELDKALGLDF